MTFQEIERRGLETVKLYAPAMRMFRELRDRAPGSYRTALLKTELATRVAEGDLKVQGLPPLSEDWRLGFLLSEYGKVFIPEAYGENQQGFNVLWELRESSRESVEFEAEHGDLAWYLIRLPATFGPRYVPEGLPAEVVRSMREQYGTFPTFLGPEHRQTGPKPQNPETVLLMLSTLAVAMLANKTLRDLSEAGSAFFDQVQLRIDDEQFSETFLSEDKVWEFAITLVGSLHTLAEAATKDRDVPIWNALEAS